MDNPSTSSNNNDSSINEMNEDGLVHPYPTSSFPAWVPAVSVAVGMMAFLAASFYIRHRKVIKKRELLMDYFYIIFQYGGLRRKRMVAALCNTNAITLRELGRSFMISFDSIANTENSCPFYLEDGTAFNSQSRSTTPVMHKKSFLKTRGMLSSKKSRAPFRRYGTTTDETQGPNPVSFQDILMKFKSKRVVGGSPSIPTTPRRQVNQQLKGSSMSTIYGDDFDFQKYREDNHLSPPSSPYHSHRRNAYVANYDTERPNFADIVSEMGRYSLGNVQTSGIRVEQVKRNSDPCRAHTAHQGSQSSQQADSPRVFQVHGDSIVCGSHGYIPKAHESLTMRNSITNYRNSEPTILIHAASNDSDSSHGWEDIRSRYTNGLVFLKKVPKGDGAAGEFYYEEETIPQPRTARTSLSKVNYVPSGNMNEYYNCLHNPKKEDVGENSDISVKNPTASRGNAGAIPGPSRNKRTRLSLGEIAVSNFNKRIEMTSESLQECDIESSMESRGSQDSAIHQSQPKSRTTWMRFKNVFTGSRASKKSDHTQVKTGTGSLPSMEDRFKRRNRRQNFRWQKFVKVFTGFRSLPENHHLDYSVEMEKPKGSNSLPSMSDVVQLEKDWPGSRKWHGEINTSQAETDLSAVVPMSRQDPDIAETENSEILRPTTLTLPSKTHSFPEELASGRQYYQRFKNVFDASTALKNVHLRRYHSQLRQHQKPQDSMGEPSSVSLPHISDYFKGHPLHTSSVPDNIKDTFRFRKELNASGGAVTPGRLEGNSDTHSPQASRRVRSLSPLPERSFSYSPSKELYHPVDSGVASGGSMHMTPIERENLHNGFITGETSSDISNYHVSPHHFGHDVSFNTHGSGDACGMFQHIPAFKETANSNPLNRGIIMTVENGQNQMEANGAFSEQPVWVRQEESKKVLPPYTSGLHHRKDSDVESEKRASSTDLLIPDHKILALSNDSVYYDTVSAFGTPSPQDNTLGDINLPSYDFVTNHGKTRSHSPCEWTKSDPTGKKHLRRYSATSGSSRQSRSQPATPTSSHLTSPHLSRAPSPVGFRPLDSNPSNVTPSRILSHSPVHSISMKDESTTQGTSNLPVDFSSSLYTSPTPMQNTNTSGLGSYSPVPCYQNVLASPHTSRHSSITRSNTLSRTPQRSPTRQDGVIPYDEGFKANLTRLPRFPRRASYGAALSYSTVPNVTQNKGESVVSEATVEEDQIIITTATTSPGSATTSPGLATTSPGLATTSPGLATTSPGLVTTSPGLATATNENISQSQATISPYDTLI